MTNSLEVTLTLNEEHARTMLDALDLWSRLGMGQLEEVEKVLRLRMLDKPVERLDALQAFATQLKVSKGPLSGLLPDQHHGIASTQTPETAKVACDVYETLRHALSWAQRPWGNFTVDFDEPRHYSHQPLPTVKANGATASS